MCPRVYDREHFAALVAHKILVSSYTKLVRATPTHRTCCMNDAVCCDIPKLLRFAGMGEPLVLFLPPK
jgi:hypothetical protein